MSVIEERKRLGIDRYDEVWDGEYRVSPDPTYEHQRICLELALFLSAVAKRTQRGTATISINVIDAPEGWFNFRCPDVTFVAAGREWILAGDGTRVHAPDVVFEIRSPGDDSYLKLPFYAKIGVREVIIIDRDTKWPEIFRPHDGVCSRQPDQAGDVTSHVMQVRFVVVPDSAEPRLRVEDIAEPAIHAIV